MDAKNDQVFQLSLTEIFIIICFILLLLMGYQVYKLNHKNKELTQKISSVVNMEERERALSLAANDLKIKLSSIGIKNPDEIVTRLIDASKAKEDAGRLKVLLDEKEAQLTALASIEKALEQTSSEKKDAEAKRLILQTVISFQKLKELVLDKPEDKDFTPEDVVKRIGRLKENEQLIKDALEDKGENEISHDDVKELVQNAKAYESLSKNDTNPVVLQKANKDLRGQIQYLQNRLNSGRGIDLPPCWVNEQTGKIEMLFTLELRENTVSLEPAWPSARQEDAMALPGINGLLANRSRSYDDFMEAVKPINALSKQRECRFYVRLSSLIPDAVTSDRRRLLIETVFYKTEVRR